jgi:hypothetical protein
MRKRAYTHIEQFKPLIPSMKEHRLPQKRRKQRHMSQQTLFILSRAKILILIAEWKHNKIHYQAR